MDEMTEAVENLGIGILNWATAFVDEFEKHVMPGLEQFHSSVQNSYEEAGSPYGEGPEAMGRWFHEQVFGPPLTREDAHRFLTTGNPW